MARALCYLKNMKSFADEQRKAALIQEITTAFDGVSRANSVSLSEARVIDDCGTGSYEERAEARKQDTETRWQDVSDHDICTGNWCLSFLDDIGFRYYIPAYIVWFLRNIDNEDPEAPSYSSDTFDSLIYALKANDGGGLDEFHLSKYKLFTPEQSKAIAHFLEFEKKREDDNEREYVAMRLTRMSEQGFPQEEIDDFERKAEQFFSEGGSSENNARCALERYWGQFK